MRLRVNERVEEEAVDGEVAAFYVFFGAEGVADGVGMAAVGVGAVGAEGGDLCHKAGTGAFGGYKDHAEVGSYRESAREHFEHDAGSGAGGYVVVGRSATEEEIANAATGQVGLMPGGTECLDDFESRFELGSGGEHGSL